MLLQEKLLKCFFFLHGGNGSLLLDEFFFKSFFFLHVDGSETTEDCIISQALAFLEAFDRAYGVCEGLDWLETQSSPQI